MTLVLKEAGRWDGKIIVELFLRSNEEKYLGQIRLKPAHFEQLVTADYGDAPVAVYRRGPEGRG